MKIPYSACSYDLPEMETCSVPLHIAVQLPANGYVREPLKASIFFKNTGGSSLELDITMDSNDAFMFAGNKQVSIPFTTSFIIYSLLIFNLYSRSKYRYTLETTID